MYFFLVLKLYFELYNLKNIFKSENFFQIVLSEIYIIERSIRNYTIWKLLWNPEKNILNYKIWKVWIKLIMYFSNNKIGFLPIDMGAWYVMYVKNSQKVFLWIHQFWVIYLKF